MGHNLEKESINDILRQLQENVEKTNAPTSENKEEAAEDILKRIEEDGAVNKALYTEEPETESAELELENDYSIVGFEIQNDSTSELDETDAEGEAEAIAEAVRSFVEDIDNQTETAEIDILDKFAHGEEKVEDESLKNKDCLNEEACELANEEDLPELTVESVVQELEEVSNELDNRSVDEPFAEDCFAVDGTGDLDDTDINVGIALGVRDDLENHLGFKRVREAKNNFDSYDNNEFIHRDLFAYDGSEYTSPEQIDDIKKRYHKSRKAVLGRFIMTFIVTFAIMVFEHLNFASIDIPYVSEVISVAFNYCLISIFLSIVCISISFKHIKNGIIGFFTMRPTSYTLLSVVVVANLIYELFILFAFGGECNFTYNFAVSVMLLLAMAKDYMKQTRESITFDVVTNGSPKVALERMDKNFNISPSGANGVKLFEPKKDFYTEKVEFVGKYFKRTGHRSSSHIEHLTFSLIALAVSVLVSFVNAYFSGNFANVSSTFIISLLICIPSQYIVTGGYPFYKLASGLSKFGCAVIGDSVIDEYADAETVYFGEDDVFGENGVATSAIKVYNKNDIKDVIGVLYKLFSSLGAPLCNAFDGIVNSTDIADNREAVYLCEVEEDGIDATIGALHVSYGTLEFINRKGIFLKKESSKTEENKTAETKTMYMAVDGLLCAKIYVQYNLSSRFEKILAKMGENSVNVGIRTLDPGVNEGLIRSLLGKKDCDVKVIRPTYNELVTTGRISDSGIITSNDAHMMSKILTQCSKIKHINKTNRLIRVISVAVGAVISVVISITNITEYILPLYIVIYQMIWLIPSICAINKELK